MDYEQIAHDLAIAKLYGSDLQTKELIDEYRKYYNEILNVLKPEQPRVKKAKISQPPNIFR